VALVCISTPNFEVIWTNTHRTMVIVGQADAAVLGDNVVVNGQDRLSIHPHPGHLVALEVLHHAGHQGISSHGDGDIGNGLREPRKVRI